MEGQNNLLTHGRLAHSCAEVQQGNFFNCAGLNVLLKTWEQFQIFAISMRTRHDSLSAPSILLNDFNHFFALPGLYDGIGWGRLPIKADQWREVQQTFLPLVNPHQSLIITGHSIGAGISQMLALYLHKLGYHVHEWVGFGAPRVFSGQRNWGGVKLTNYRYGKDIVPSLRPLGVYFHHPVKPTPIGEAIRPYNNWLDHAIENYVVALN